MLSNMISALALTDANAIGIGLACIGAAAEAAYYL